MVMYGVYCGLAGIGVACLGDGGEPVVAYRALGPAGLLPNPVPLAGREKAFARPPGPVPGPGLGGSAWRAGGMRDGAGGKAGGRELQARIVRAAWAARWVASWLEEQSRPGPVGLAAYPHSVRQQWMIEQLFEAAVLVRVELVRRGWRVSEEHLERLGTNVEVDDRETIIRRAVTLARMMRGAPAIADDPRPIYAVG